MTREQREKCEAVGYWGAWGVAKFFWQFVLLVLLIGAAFNALGIHKADDSDKSIWERSGLRPRTDHRTGCQYLEAANGGLTPRLDATGQHICGRPTQ